MSGEPEVRIDVKIRWPAKKYMDNLQHMVPLTRGSAVLGGAIRDRVEKTGRTARGGHFYRWLKPLRAADKLQWIPKRWLEQAAADASDNSRQRRNRYIGARVLAEDTKRGRVLVELRRLEFGVPTRMIQKFSYTGASWRNLKVQLTSKGRVRIGFAGSSPPGFSVGSPGRKGDASAAPVRNAVKMTMQNRPHDDHLMEPTDAEVQGVLDGMAGVMDDELRAVMRDAHPPQRRPGRGAPQLTRRVLHGVDPLR